MNSFFIIKKGTGRKFSYYSKARGLHIDMFNSKGAVTRVMNEHDLHDTHDAVPVADYKPVMVERRNLMSGLPYMEDINTPACCSPAYETYWSM